MNKNTARKILTWIALTTFVVPNALGQVLPDEYNFKKYEQDYLKKQRISDQKRDLANTALDQVHAKESELSSIERDLDHAQITIQTLQNNIQEFKAEEITLRDRNNYLISQEKRHQSDASSLRSQMNFENQKLNQIERQYDQERNRLQPLQVAHQQAHARYLQALQRSEQLQGQLNQIEQAIQQALKQIQDKTREQQQTQTQLSQAQQNVNSIQTRISQLQASEQSSVAKLSALQNLLQQAQQRLNQLMVQQNQIQSQLSAAQTELSNANSALSYLESQIDSLQSEVNKNQNEIQQAQNRLTALQNEQSQIQGKIATLNNQYGAAKKAMAAALLDVQSIDQQIAALEARKIELQKRSREIADEIRQLESTSGPLGSRRILVLKGELLTIGTEIQKIDSDLQTFRNQRLNAQKQVDQNRQLSIQIQGQIQNLQLRELALPNEIQAAKNTLAQNQSTLQQNQSKLTSLQGQVSPARNRQQQAQNQFNQLQGQMAPIQSQVNQLAQEVQSLQQQISQLNSKLAQVRNDLVQANSQLQAVQNSIPTLQNQLNRLQQEVANLNQRSQQLEQQVLQVRDQLRIANQDTQNAKNAADTAGQVFHQQNMVVDRLEGQVQSQRNVVDGLAQNLAEVEKDLQQVRGELGDNQSRLQTLASAVIQSQTALSQWNAEIPRLQNQISAIQAALNSLRLNYAAADQVAAQAEQITELARVEFQTRKDRYDAEISTAEAQGEGEGRSLGQRDGEQNGKSAGAIDGQAKGAAKGTTEGLEYGFQTGLKQGETDGYSKGYSQGVASTSDYQTAFSQGQILGIEQAENEAMATSYLEGKSDKYKELTSVLPRKVVQVDQSASSFQFVRSVSDRKLEVAYLILNGGAASFQSRPASNCQQSILDFKNACQAKFEISYDDALKDTYPVAYESSYNQSFAVAYNAAFKANESVRVQDGYNTAFPNAFKKGLSEGIAVAKNRGLKDGKEDGYRGHIGQARQLAYAKGEAETVQFFQSYAVLKILNVDYDIITPTGTTGSVVFAGDVLDLKLKLANFGTPDSNSREHIEILSASSGLAPENTVVQLKKLPGNAQIHLSHVLRVKVKDSAVSGSTESLRIRFMDAEGKTSDHEIKVQVAHRIKIDITKIEYESRPRLGRLQKIRVTVHNVGDIDPTQKVTLNLVSQSAGVSLSQDSLVVQSLEAGTIWRIGFLTYTVTDAIELSKGIKLDVIVKHGAYSIVQKTIQLKN